MQAASLRFAPQPAERASLAAAAATYFLLLCGYYMLRSLREAMVLQAGSERIPFFFLITLCAMLAVLPVYWWVVARVSRRNLMACVYAPIIVLFAHACSTRTR